jgi:ankyrin repeat protein
MNYSKLLLLVVISLACTSSRSMYKSSADKTVDKTILDLSKLNAMEKKWEIRFRGAPDAPPKYYLNVYNEQEIVEKFRQAVLAGGKAIMQANSPEYLELLTRAFPNRFLQAIARNDESLVEQQLLYQGAPTVVTDSEGNSALAYAAAQGNEKIISLLLRYHIYSKNTDVLQQAIKIVESILNNLAPNSHEHKLYQHIHEALTAHLASLHGAQIEALAQQPIVQQPPLQAPIFPQQTSQSQSGFFDSVKTYLGLGK